MDQKMKLAVNELRQQCAAANDQRMARMRALAFNPSGGLDNKRPGLWCEFGYPEHITNDHLIALYRRGGVPHGAVNRIVDACWSTPPELIEGGRENANETESAWERKASQVMDGPMWLAFQEADRRRMVGRYSALILRVRDGQKFDRPITSKTASLAGVIPVWSTALKPQEYDTNETSDTYGQPTLWQYTPSMPDGSPAAAVQVHRDRVFLLGDWSKDAIGFLEPAYNNFVNLEKVEGGAAEGLLKNSARQMNLNFDSSVDLNTVAASYGVPLDELRGEFQKIARDLSEGNDTLLISQGATATPLSANLPDPKSTWEINVAGAASGLGVATRILTGNQSGERASSEDRAEFNAMCQSRRVKTIGPDVLRFAARMQELGVLPQVPEVSCAWDDLREPTTAEKLGNAKLLTEINQLATGAGDTLPFDTDEIRVAAGYEPGDAREPLGEEEPDEEGADGNPPAA